MARCLIRPTNSCHIAEIFLCYDSKGQKDNSMNHMEKLDSFIQQAVTAMPVSGTSLIASLYGDCLSQRGGEVWLGSVAALLEGLWLR